MPIPAFNIEIIRAVKNMIDADIRTHHTIGYLAEQAGMSESKLKETFKQVVETTLYAYLKKKRMELATTLLQQHNSNIKLVSKQVGFKYYSNFTRAFKKYVGITPAMYRKQFKEHDNK